MFQEVPAGAVVQNEHLFKRVILWKNLGIGNIRDNFKDLDRYFIERKQIEQGGDHKMYIPQLGWCIKIAATSNAQCSFISKLALQNL